MITGWDTLVGQDITVDTLKRAVRDARLRPPGSAMTHAWLIIGPPGAGRSTAAALFAAALQCDDGGCGECRNCREVQHDTHPDVVRFIPQQLQITVDEARGLITRAGLAPDHGTWTVMIVEDADRLNEISGNSAYAVPIAVPYDLPRYDRWSSPRAARRMSMSRATSAVPM